MTRESAYRLANGGNESRGSVPIHRSESNTARIPVYVCAPPVDRSFAYELELFIGLLGNGLSAGEMAENIAAWIATQSERT